MTYQFHPIPTSFALIPGVVTCGAATAKAVDMAAARWKKDATLKRAQAAEIFQKNSKRSIGKRRRMTINLLRCVHLKWITLIQVESRLEDGSREPKLSLYHSDPKLAE